MVVVWRDVDGAAVRPAAPRTATNVASRVTLRVIVDHVVGATEVV